VPALIDDRVLVRKVAELEGRISSLENRRPYRWDTLSIIEAISARPVVFTEGEANITADKFTHFRTSGTAGRPADHSWETADFNGVPATEEYASGGSWARWGTSSQPNFLAKSGLGTPADGMALWLGGPSVSLNNAVGLRIDDGSSGNNSVEVKLIPYNSFAGLNRGECIVRISYEVAGVPSSVSGPAMPIKSWPITFCMMWYQSGIYVYLADMIATRGLMYNIGVGWTPDRAGIVLQYTGGNPCYADWYYCSFD
jgi:hypothetical protein